MRERERERERESVCVCVCTSRGGTEEEGERIPSRLHNVSTEPNVGLKLMNCEIMAEPKSIVGHLTD